MDELSFTEAEVTLDLLIDAFNTDVFKSHRIDDSIVIREGLFNPTHISIDEHSGAMKFRTRVTIHDDADSGDVADLIEHLNCTVTCCHFFLSTDDEGGECLCGSAFLIIHFGMRLLELYFFVTAFSSAFAAGCRVASEHNLIDVRSTAH